VHRTRLRFKTVTKKLRQNLSRHIFDVNSIIQFDRTADLVAKRLKKFYLLVVDFGFAHENRITQGYSGEVDETKVVPGLNPKQVWLQLRSIAQGFPNKGLDSTASSYEELIMGLPGSRLVSRIRCGSSERFPILFDAIVRDGRCSRPHRCGDCWNGQINMVDCGNTHSNGDRWASGLFCDLLLQPSTSTKSRASVGTAGA
jgi:hypothetical protein